MGFKVSLEEGFFSTSSVRDEVLPIVRGYHDDLLDYLRRTHFGPFKKHPFPRKDASIKTSKEILTNFKTLCGMYDKGRLTGEQKKLLIRRGSFSNSTLGRATDALYRELYKAISMHGEHGNFNPKPYVRRLNELQSIFERF